MEKARNKNNIVILFQDTDITEFAMASDDILVRWITQ